MGKIDGFLSNETVPDSLRQSKTWEFGELTLDEFMHLEIPDKTQTLIMDKESD